MIDRSLRNDSIVAAIPSCLKPPEPRNRQRQIIKMSLRYNKKYSLLWVMLHFGAGILVLYKT
jgi:hypothetical protein